MDRVDRLLRWARTATRTDLPPCLYMEGMEIKEGGRNWWNARTSPELAARVNERIRLAAHLLNNPVPVRLPPSEVLGNGST